MARLLGVGEKFPEFSLDAVVSIEHGKEFKTVSKKELSETLGVLHPKDLVPLRATYIVDPEGTVRWVSVNDLSVGRNVKEVLRTLDGLQTEKLVPCNWEKGQATLN